MKPSVVSKRSQRVHAAPGSSQRAQALQPEPAAQAPESAKPAPLRPTSTVVVNGALRAAIQFECNRPVPRADAAPNRKPALRVAAGAILAALAIAGAWRLLHSRPTALKTADVQIQQISE